MDKNVGKYKYSRRSNANTIFQKSSYQKIADDAEQHVFKKKKGNNDPIADMNEEEKKGKGVNWGQA